MGNINQSEDKERSKEYNMKYYSEMTDKVYETKEECEKAEEAIVAKKKAEEEKQLALKNERETRSKAVVDAFKKAREAEAEAQKLLKEFVKDYGSFHISYNGKSSIPSMFDVLNDFFWFWLRRGVPGSSFFLWALTTDVGAFFLWGNWVGAGKWVYEYFCPEIVFSIENTFQKV